MLRLLFIVHNVCCVDCSIVSLEVYGRQTGMSVLPLDFLITRRVTYVERETDNSVNAEGPDIDCATVLLPFTSSCSTLHYLNLQCAIILVYLVLIKSTTNNPQWCFYLFLSQNIGYVKVLSFKFQR